MTEAALSSHACRPFVRLSSLLRQSKARRRPSASAATAVSRPRTAEAAALTPSRRAASSEAAASARTQVASSSRRAAFRSSRNASVAASAACRAIVYARHRKVRQSTEIKQSGSSALTSACSCASHSSSCSRTRITSARASANDASEVAKGADTVMGMTGAKAAVADIGAGITAG